jgi:hypothetical protein
MGLMTSGYLISSPNSCAVLAASEAPTCARTSIGKKRSDDYGMSAFIEPSPHHSIVRA